MAQSYTGLVFMLLLSFGIAGAMLAMALLFGPKNTTATKQLPFECGHPSTGTQNQRFSVRFYLVALLFVVFEIEVVFMYPWAVMYRSLGVVGLVEMAVFMAILAVGFVYVWRRGALDWE
jgi:NADH-quinone oxidoreductase subunit A